MPVVTIQLRRDMAENWTSINPVLHQGEVGVETDTEKAKLGDGTSAWTDLAYWNPMGTDSGGDKNFVATFSVTATVTVSHGLGKYPSVSVMDSSDDLVMGDVDYLDLNNLTVSFSAPFSGTITCN